MGERVRAGWGGLAAVLAVLLGGQCAAAAAERPVHLVWLREQADLSATRGIRWATARSLKETARRVQAPLLARLERWQRQGLAEAFQPLWIVNAIAVCAQKPVLSALQQDPAVAAVTPAPPVRLPPCQQTRARASSDPWAWNVAQVGAPLIWSEYGTQGAGIRIGVLDTGVDARHPDLAGGRVALWKDFVTPGNASPVDPHGHGTMVCGTLAGGNTGGTAIGIAPQATLLVARMLDGTGNGNMAWTLAAMQWVMDPDGNPDTPDGADVVNCSWGGPSTAPVLDGGYRMALDAWRAAGIFSAFAIGNSGPHPRTTYSPGDYPGVPGVGAVDRRDAVLHSSSRGPVTWNGTGDLTKPDLVAPGENVYTAGGGGTYVLGSGSSLACPHVTGAAALMLAVAHAWGVSADADSLVQALRKSAVDLGPPGADNDTGWGRVNALGAVHALIASAPGVRLELPVLGLTTFAASLGSPVTREAVGLASVPMKAWDASARTYIDAPATLEPGRGYWVKAAARVPVALSGPARREAASVAVQPGWNLIGSPFLVPTEWSLSRLQVQRAGEPPRPLRDARNLMEDFAWGWQQDGANPHRGSYVLVYDSAILPGAAHQLAPWQGYWVKAKAACSLLLPAPGRTAIDESAPATANRWSVRLEARCGDARQAVTLGVLAGRSWVAPPPPVPPEPIGGFSILLERGGVPLAADLRPGLAAPQEWDVVVTSPHDVVLSWPDLRALPEDVSLTLVDLATGVRYSLRHTPACVFACGEAGRRFRVLAERRDPAPVRITGLRVAGTRSGQRTVQFDLSVAATVDVEVLSPAGRVLTTLARRTAAQAGRNQVAWRGGAQPGIYWVCVVASTEEGTCVRAVAPAAIVR